MEIVIPSLLKGTTKKQITKVNYFFSLVWVSIPKGRYKGQEPIKLTNDNTAAIPNNTSPNVPEILPNKYNAIIIAATTKRRNLSTLPMFFFIC